MFNRTFMNQSVLPYISLSKIVLWNFSSSLCCIGAHIEEYKNRSEFDCTKRCYKYIHDTHTHTSVTLFTILSVKVTVSQEIRNKTSSSTISEIYLCARYTAELNDGVIMKQNNPLPTMLPLYLESAPNDCHQWNKSSVWVRVCVNSPPLPPLTRTPYRPALDSRYVGKRLTALYVHPAIITQ